MKSVNTLSHTDRTSWSRVAMVWRFYLPRFRTMLWLYPLISVTLLLIARLSTQSWGIFANTPLSLLSFMATLAPLAFALRPDKEITVTLPALAIEKTIVIFGLSFVIMPLLTYGPVFLLNAIMGWDCLAADLPKEIAGTFSLDTVRVSNFITGCAQIATCLWIVTILDHHRALFATIATIGINFLQGIIAGIWGLVMALRLKPGLSSDDVSREILSGFMDQFLTVMGIVTASYAIIAIYFTARAIKDKQI